MNCFVDNFLVHASTVSKRSDSELDLLWNAVFEWTFSKCVPHYVMSVLANSASHMSLQKVTRQAVYYSVILRRVRVIIAVVEEQ